MVKKGFTFIELVLAIIVMAIALMSVPLMLSQASNSNQFSLNQEVLLASFTKMEDILSYAWDEKQTGDSTVKKVLDVTNGNTNLNRYPNSNSNRRIGHFIGNYRRKFYSTITYASAIGTDIDDNGTKNDIDDFNDTNYTMQGGGGGDYIKTFTIQTTVSYIKLNDFNVTATDINLGNLNLTPSSGTTNIKMVTIKSVEQNKTISSLSSFATNIGSYQLLYRTFK